MTTAPDKLQSVNAIADACGVTWNTAKAWSQRGDFPVPDKDGWNRKDILQYARNALEEAAKAQAGVNADLKRVKLQREILRLDELVKLDAERRKQAELETARIEGRMIPDSEVREMLAELCDCFKGGLQSFVQLVGVELGDPKAVHTATVIRNRILREVQAKVSAE